VIGKTVAHYEIIEKLGEGGMGIVYLAKDTRLEREVAIKFLPHHIAPDQKSRERFKIEAKTAAALNHPNITQIFAIEEFKNETFIVMEYVSGVELRELVRDEPLPFEKAIHIAKQIVDGLQAAHEKGVVHRDIKSSNIMITEKGQIKIMDFGLAKFKGSAQLTQKGTTLGTAAYMSPEQIRGEKASESSDIWSFGVVFYELLTGELPFNSIYEQAAMYSIVNEDPRPITELQEDIPAVVESIVSRCLNKEIEERSNTFDEIALDLKGLLEDDPSRSEFKPRTMTFKFPVSIPDSKKRLLTWSGTILIILLVLIFSSDTIRDLLSLDSAVDEHHLLVLPFTNIGNEAGQQKFCDGLVEILTSKLSQLEQYHGSLWVVPASEVRKHKITSSSEANQRYGVNLAVTGSLQQFEDSYRITLNLVDAKKLRLVNSSIVDVEKSNLSFLQDITVAELLAMLNLELNPESKKMLHSGNTTLPGAYEFYLQGRGYLLRHEKPENINAAIDLFERAISIDTAYAVAYSGLGEAYWLKYEGDKNPRWVEMAINNSEHAKRIDSELAPVNVTLGIIYAGTGKYQIAIEAFNRSLESDPTNHIAFTGLANAYAKQGKLKEAESTYKKAIALKPDYWGGYNALGTFYYRQGKFENALNQFRKVIKLTPENYRGYNTVGAMLYYLKHLEEAKEMYLKSLAIKETYRAANNLAILYYSERLYPEAARMYERALKQNDHDYRLWGNLASAYYWTNDERDKSIPTVKKAIELAEEQRKINPRDPYIISDLANYYSDSGDQESALSLTHKVLDMAPDDMKILYGAAVVYEKLGDRDGALHWLERAIKSGHPWSDIEQQPDFQDLIADPRYMELKTKIAEESQIKK